MIPLRRMALAGLAGVLIYCALSFALFQMPQTLEAAQDCGFLPGEFSGGGLTMERGQAFLTRFLRMQEYFTALTMGLTLAFVTFALHVRRGGAIAAGSGLLVVSALCVSCLAPVLSVVGLGVAGSLLAGIPKGLIALNTLLLTGWGGLYLSRKGATCSIPATKVMP